jgi:arylsulfatase A-like enzyme
MCAVWPGKIAPGNAALLSGATKKANQDRDPKRDESRLGTQIGGPSGAVALTMDLFPTICEAAGVPIEHEIDGRSILPILMGKTQPEDDRILFWVRREGGPQYGGRAYYAARQRDFKLLQNSPFEPMELYNLKDDPQEQKPLGRKHPMYNKLFTALQGHITQAGAVSWQKYPVDLKQPLTHQP